MAEEIPSRGSAGVFGGSINPLQLYLQQSANRQRNAQLQAQQQRDQTSKLIDYQDKFLPSTKFDGLNQVLFGEANKLKEESMQLMASGKSNSQVANWSYQKQNAIRGLGKEMDGWKAALDEKDKEINQHIANGRLKEKETKDSLRFGWKNNDGSTKDIPTIRQFMNEDINTVQNKPENINPEGAARYWIDHLKDQAREMYSTKWNDGHTPDDIENTLTSKLKYHRDGQGDLIYDKSGNPVPIIDGTTLALAKQDPFMKTLMDTYGGGDDISKAEYLKGLIVPGSDITKQDRKITRGIKNNDDDKFRYYQGIDFGSGNKVPPQKVMNRFENIESIVKGFEPGKLTQFVDRTKGESGHYTNEKGDVIESTKNINGHQYFFNENGESVAKPDRIELEVVDSKKAAANQLQEYIIQTNANLSDKEKEEKISLLKKPMVKVKFKLGTNDNLIDAHNEMSDILDAKYTKTQSYKEAYEEVMKAKYGDNSKNMSIAERMKQATQKR